MPPPSASGATSGRGCSDTRLPEVLGSKAPLLAPLQRSLPGGYKFTAIKDLADELEWAKARRLDPSSYQAAAEAIGRTPPIPGDLFAGVFRRYERAKERAGRIDFEDMLVRMLEGFENPARTRPRSSAAGTAGSRSTSTRTPTRSSRRCSRPGWGSGATWPWSATRTRPSTPSPGPPPST